MIQVWNDGDPYHFIEFITQGYSVARGGGTKKFFNIFHFRRTTTVNVVDKTHINTAFNLIIGPAILAALSVDYTQTANTVRFFENPLDAPFTITQAGVGAIAGDRLPDFAAVVTQFHSGFRGKPFRGSKHWGPIAESDTTGDDLTAGAVTRFTTVMTSVVAGFTDADGNVWVPGIKGGVRFGSPAQYLVAPTTTVWTDIGYGVLNKSLGTMKRRKIATVN